jgi:hypothetical protein
MLVMTDDTNSANLGLDGVLLLGQHRNRKLSSDQEQVFLELES